MYELHLKGKTIIELKKAVEDAAAELNGFTGTTVGMRIEKTVREEKQLAGPFTNGDDEDDYVDESEIGAGLKTSMGTHSGVELDSEGISWDARIHSSSKAQNLNGSWKLKKGVDKNLVNTVKVELRGGASRSHNPEPGNNSIPNAQVPTSNVVPMNQNIQQPVQQNWGPPPTQQPIMQVPVVQAPVVPPQPVQQFNGGYTFESFKNNFAMVIAGLINGKKLDQNYINTLKNYWKVNEIWELNDSQMFEAFNSFAGWGWITIVG